jgi:hypothetical protein
MSVAASAELEELDAESILADSVHIFGSVREREPVPTGRV